MTLFQEGILKTSKANIFKEQLLWSSFVCCFGVFLTKTVKTLKFVKSVLHWIACVIVELISQQIKELDPGNIQSHVKYKLDSFHSGQRGYSGKTKFSCACRKGHRTKPVKFSD